MASTMKIALLLVMIVIMGTEGVRGQQGGGEEKKSDSYDYGIVIDLGSKGSRVSIFTWPSNSDTPRYTEVEFGGGKNPWYSKITPGIASFAGNPSKAGPYLKPLLDYATSNVPSDQYSTTPIFIRGTDNLRQLPSGQAEAIMDSISNFTAHNYPFLITPNCITLLPGILEAGFMWVAANYLQGNFQDGGSTVGTLDMGSGSTQITFLPKAGTVIPTNYYYLFTYEKTNYSPYAHSYTGYGYINTLYAINSTIVQSSSSNIVYNPCLLDGYETTYQRADATITMQGTGSWSQCGTLTFNYLNATAPCLYQPCSFDGAYLPALHGDFIAVSNYVDVANILGFSDTATVSDLIAGGIKYCSLSWKEAQAQFPDEDPDDLATFCFGANYITTLLAKGYRFDLDSTISFDKTYNKDPYTWALGAMIYELQMGW
jgi:Golgi nucleoside diphosphatase